MTKHRKYKVIKPFAEGIPEADFKIGDEVNLADEEGSNSLFRVYRDNPKNYWLMDLADLPEYLEQIPATPTQPPTEEKRNTKTYTIPDPNPPTLIIPTGVKRITLEF